MSMKLHCDFVELWQTPTSITKMCLFDGSILYYPILRKKEARRALSLYKIWASGTIDGAWSDEGELSEAREALRLHLDEVDQAILKRGLEVYAV